MTTEQEPLTLEDLNYFWTKSGVPCFMADRDNIEDIIENLGFTIYYLICNIAEDRKIENKIWDKGVQKVNTTILTDFSTSIVKVVNNFVGRSVTQVKNEDIYDFQPVREGATYSLPPIPREIVSRLDEFFRLVDFQHGTESIVLLTFDPNFVDNSEGWGILVPDQVNTSVHCKYDPDSVVNQKPDHVMIVGSVHSHPNMAAFSSGVDHDDQADFDGLHITYGWQKSVNNGATQYHIEMQMSGSVWTLKPEDVFADVTFNKEPDPQVIEWTSKVKKVLPPQGGPLTLTPPTRPIVQEFKPPQRDYIQVGIKGDPFLQVYPDPKDPNPYIVVAEVDISKNLLNLKCPSCNSVVHGYSHEFVCNNCDMLFALCEDSHQDILESVDRYLERRNKSKNVSVYLWVAEDDDQEQMMLKIQDFYNVSYSDNEIDDAMSRGFLEPNNLDAYYYEGFNYENTVCCDRPLSDLYLSPCDKCTVPVTYNDIVDYDYDHPHNVYDPTASCHNCEHYYTRQCVPYLTSILDHAKDKTKIQTLIKECSLFVHWTVNSLEKESY